uniref:Uncharacterized protein n=1 Tax=Panagrolaimus superbus TaxID=310955 RepID=A0A914YZX8_9BILA
MGCQHENRIIPSFLRFITNVIREFTNDDEKEEKGKEHLKWTKTYNRLMTVRKAIDEQKRVPGAKVYEHRMYDLVLDKEEPSLTPSERHSTTGIMHDSMKLLQRLTSSNSSTNNATAPYYRALSPRFMPLMPLNDGKNAPETLLSPTIMAMYDEPKKSPNELSIGSVPGMLQSLGVSKIDRDKILQVVMDLSGSKTHIDEALKIYETLGMFDEDVAEPLLNATERIMGAFQKLEKSFFPDQKFLYDNRGFAFLKKHQMEKLMRDHGHTEDEIDLADFDIYDKMSDEEMEISLWKTIENIAINKTDVLRPSEAIKGRQKRDMIYFMQPTILSPFMFTIQKGVSIAGPLILSPTAFAPPIFNPAIASPWILSPGIFDPFILSPYILCPFILGPLAFTPFILTPYFLSPNVLNPYVMSSLIFISYW